MKYFKRLLIFFSVIILYFIFKEFLQLFVLIRNIHPYAGITFLLVALISMIYFVIFPLIQILKHPKIFSPVYQIEKEAELITIRLQLFADNKIIQSNQELLQIEPDPKIQYKKIVEALHLECQKIQKKYVNRVFYTTSISQNGFIDAFFILTNSINMIKEIFILYNGRVSNKQLFIILKKIYFSMLIGGSDGVEYAVDEIFSKLASDSLKSVPFLDKILGSLADGFVNAMLVTRISLITENYCTLTFIKSDRDLIPSTKIISNTTKHLLSEIFSSINKELIKVSGRKTMDSFKKIVNPVTSILKKAKGKFYE